MNIVKPTNRYEDERGVIENITPDFEVKDILYITGKKGAVRGNHYHKEDMHSCYVVSGRIKYTEEDMIMHIKHTGVLEPGDIILSTSEVMHKFEFLEDGAFIAMAYKSRDQEDYEQDTVRVVL